MNRIENLRNAKQQFANELMNMDKFMNYLINLTEEYELELNKKEQENITLRQILNVLLKCNPVVGPTEDKILSELISKLEK